MTTIASLIISNQAEIESRESAKQAEIEGFNKERIAAQEAAFRNLFGDLYEEVMEKSESHRSYGSNGHVGELILGLQDDDLQLAPMIFVWSPYNGNQPTVGNIYCKVPWVREQLFDLSRQDITLAATFYYARQQYPKWKALEEQKEAVERERSIRSLKTAVQKLNHPSLHDEVKQLIEKLQSLDPDLAGITLQEWYSRVLQEYENNCYWGPDQAESTILALHENLSAIDKRFADEKLSLYRANVAKDQRRQAAEEEERKRQSLEREKYRSDCRIWAETETARLWQPFTVIGVRYAPVSYVGSMDEDIDVIQKVYAVGNLEDVAAAAAKPGALLDVYSYGKVQKHAIGAFLDAAVADNFTTMPAVEIPARYHANRYAGGFYVNYPPFIADLPIEPPAHPFGHDDDEIPL